MLGSWFVGACVGACVLRVRVCVRVCKRVCVRKPGSMLLCEGVCEHEYAAKRELYCACARDGAVYARVAVRALCARESCARVVRE